MAKVQTIFFLCCITTKLSTSKLQKLGVAFFKVLFWKFNKAKKKNITPHEQQAIIHLNTESDTSM